MTTNPTLEDSFILGSLTQAISDLDLVRFDDCDDTVLGVKAHLLNVIEAAKFNWVVKQAIELTLPDNVIRHPSGATNVTPFPKRGA